MMKIRSYPIFAALLVIFVTQTSLGDVSWPDLVLQRLDLEQANPDVLVIDKMFGPEEKKKSLDHALVLYHDRFEKFYKGAMTIIDPCKEWCETKDVSLRDKRKIDCKEWCELKDYLEDNKKSLDEKYIKLKQDYRGSLMRTDSENNKIKLYEKGIKEYYDKIIEGLQYTISEGQKIEVKLRQETKEEKRIEKIKKSALTRQLFCKKKSKTFEVVKKKVSTTYFLSF